MCGKLLFFSEVKMTEFTTIIRRKATDILNYFTKTEITLWTVSVLLILLSFFIFDRERLLTLSASLIGVTSLIFCAKGNAIGQFLMIAFSIMYGIISYGFSYYGEMLTYLCMTAPMAIFALISWLRNPYNESSEVMVGRIGVPERIFMIILSAAVTFIFYYILKYFNTANLPISTLSVTTSFLAVYMTFRRSIFFAALYAANDAVLIALWILVAATDSSYISVVVCFTVFLANDIYTFINWGRMRRRQEANPA